MKTSQVQKNLTEKNYNEDKYSKERTILYLL